MARKPKQPPAPPDPERDKLIAETLVSMPWQAANTMSAYLGAKSTDLTLALTEQIAAVHQGDMLDVERLLVAQAHTLNAIFNELALRAAHSEYLQNFETKLKLALRAQAQCARTLEVLSSIKNPPVVFARQANVATNQQINVGPQAGPPPASQPTAIDVTPQPQIERTHGNYLDTGTATATGRNDSAMATLEEIHRPEERRR